MSVQEKSQWYENGAPRHPAIVASIYFPFDNANLDGNDRAILETLARHYAVVLLGRRVNFSFVGHTDHRGASAYNRKLGERRASAVKSCLDELLRRNRYYSSYSAISEGESMARQGEADKSGMALDRRVDVYSSWVRRRIVIPEPTVITATVPRVARITRKRFSKFTTENTGQPSSPADDAFKDFIDAVPALAGDAMDRFEHTWGSEDSSARRTTQVPANFKVNSVRQRLKYSWRADGFAMTRFYSATIEYEWGEPRPQVRVQVSKEIQGMQGETKRIRTVNRQEADANPVLNPADP